MFSVRLDDALKLARRPRVLKMSDQEIIDLTKEVKSRPRTSPAYTISKAHVNRGRNVSVVGDQTVPYSKVTNAMTESAQDAVSF